MAKYHDELLQLAWDVRKPKGKHTDRGLAFLSRVDEIFRLVEEAATRAERERCAKVCRERAEVYRREAATAGTNEILREACEEAALEASACAEAIERKGDQPGGTTP